LKALYGAKDGAKCWENVYSATMVSANYIRGRSSPCLFRRNESDGIDFVHGDDFGVSGPEKDLKELRDAICSKYKAKIRATLGPGPQDDKAVIILERVVEWRADGICMEANPRHTDLTLKEMDMDNCKGSLVVGRVGREDDEGG
jgi:hypothetical protein